MKKDIIKKIALMLSSIFLFPRLSRAIELQEGQITETSEFDLEYDEDDFNENADNIPKETRVGLVSCLVNKILKKRGDEGNAVMNLSPSLEATIGAFTVLGYENIKSGLKNSNYECNPFSAENLDKAARAAGNQSDLDKLKWIIEYLHAKNDIKFEGEDESAYYKYPVYLIEKLKLFNLFVSKDISNLEKNMRFSSKVYKTLDKAICSDNAKILYLWAKLNNLPRIMVIEGYHCYTVIKIGDVWYRPEPLDPGTGEWPRLRDVTNFPEPNEGKDRKILLINPSQPLKAQTWEGTKVWDLNMENTRTLSWDEIYKVTKGNKTTLEISPGSRILKTSNLMWKIRWWY